MLGSERIWSPSGGGQNLTAVADGANRLSPQSKAGRRRGKTLYLYDNKILREALIVGVSKAGFVARAMTADEDSERRRGCARLRPERAMFAGACRRAKGSLARYSSALAGFPRGLAGYGAVFAAFFGFTTALAGCGSGLASARTGLIIFAPSAPALSPKECRSSRIWYRSERYWAMV
jgi:hypothetical protein